MHIIVLHAFLGCESISAILCPGVAGWQRNRPNFPFQSRQHETYPSSQPAVSSAQALIKAGNFEEAAAMFRQIIASDVAAGNASSNNRSQLQAPPEAFAGLVRSLLKLDDVAGAEEAAAMGLRAYPQSSITLAARGDVHFRNGGIMEAKELYQSALKIDANNARAWLGMGRVDSACHATPKQEKILPALMNSTRSDGDALYYWSVGQPYPENVTRPGETSVGISR